MVESSEVIVSLGVAFILLVVAFLAGATRSGPSSKSPQPVPTKLEPAEPQEEVQEEPPEEEVDEFSFVPVEEHSEDVTESIDTTQALVEAIEVIEIPEEEDASPSGRLASMRDELTDDGPSAEGRQDRMRRFFGNE